MGQKRKLNSASNSASKKKRNILKNIVNSNPVTLETISVRFPHLCEAIFGELDSPSLASCREWNQIWKRNIDNSKLLYTRIIRTKTIKADRFKLEWEQILVKIPLQILKTLVIAVCNFERNYITCQYSPLHAAAHYGAMYGDLSLFQYTLTRMKIKNPKDGDGATPLHIAAQLNSLEITKQILKLMNDEIPRENSGMTPHHFAALNGDLIVYKTLFNHFTDKIQQSNGVTPLCYAVKYGKLDICKFIIANSTQLSLQEEPLHIAAEKGHLEVCKLLFKNMEEKNPQNSDGKTPLQIAAENNQWKIAHYLIRANKLHI
jgi:ankyrin repeat protein